MGVQHKLLFSNVWGNQSWNGLKVGMQYAILCKY